MAAVPRRLKRIEVYCPEYNTTATIRINDAHSSGTDHLEVDYRSPDHSHFTIAIPDDWTDQDLLELIFFTTPRPRTTELAGLGNSCLPVRDVQAVQVLERRGEARQVNSLTTAAEHCPRTGKPKALGRACSRSRNGRIGNQLLRSDSGSRG